MINDSRVGYDAHDARMSVAMRDVDSYRLQRRQQQQRNVICTQVRTDDHWLSRAAMCVRQCQHGDELLLEL